MSIIIPANSAVGGGFEVDNSCRFDGANHLVRSKGASETGLTKGTFSLWVKRTNIDGGQHFLYSNTVADSSNRGYFSWRSSEKIRILSETNNASNLVLETNQLFRDPSAWYHIVYSIDTTQGTAANRCILYVNGTQVTSFSTATYMDQNSECDIFEGGQTNKEYIGGLTGGTSNLHSYLSEYVYIDGLALAADQFGEFDEDSGIWKPIDVSGLTFGNNGFYLDFQTSTELGDDVSGNTNDFTESNLTAVHQSTDTCTNNFCTLNPLTKRAGGTLTEGNLQYTASTGDSSIFGTIAISPGMKVYFEVKLVSNTAQNFIGIFDKYDGGDGAHLQGGSESGSYGYKVRGSASVVQYFNNGSGTDTAISNYANGTIIGVAIDNENGQIHLSANGTYINSSNPVTNSPAALVTGFGGANEQYLHFSLDTTSTQPSNQFNFGSPPYSESGGNSDGNGYGNFNQAVPSGYYALNTKNLAEYG